MSEPEFERPDPRQRPDDPAGTKPKVDSASLLPAVREPLVGPPVVADATAEDEPLALEPGPLVPAVEAPHTPRFQFMLGALFALGLAALAAIVLLITEGAPERTPDPVWSEWRPSGENPPDEIAQHVGQRYRQGGGEQLVNVDGGPLEINRTPVKLVISQGGNYFPVEGDGVLYNLCGLGNNCRIPTGKPSAARGFLLRREILELALYTFKYTDVDNVVAIMPPGVRDNGKPKRRQDQAVFLQREDLAEQLDRPLATTLTETPPDVGTMLASPDFGSVRAITSARSFNFRLMGAGVEGAYMVLQPLQL